MSQKDAFKINASEANITQVGDAQKKAPKKKHQNDPTKRDVSEVKCYNCNNKGYYLKYCTEPKE